MKKFVAWLNKEVKIFSLKDKLTGTIIHEFTLGRKYHWIIIWMLAIASFIIRKFL